MLTLRLTAIALALFIAGRATAADRPIVLGIIAEEPYFRLTRTGTYGGDGADKLRKLFFAVGKRLVFRALQRPEAIALAENGSIDGVALLPGKLEGDTGLHYSMPLFCRHYVFLFRKGEGLDWTVPEGLAGKRIVVLEGRDQPDAVDQLIGLAALTRIEAAEAALVFPMLAHNRADMAVLPAREVRRAFLLDDRWRDVIEQSPQPVSVTPLHLGLSKRRQASGFANRINESIRRLGIGGRC